MKSLINKNVNVETQEEKVYVCIDLKTFFASVECRLRGLDPFTTNLVVADPTRGDGTITLAITPKMKMLGIKNRCRIYEIPKNIQYIKAMPRINTYMDFSANIYEMYLEYFSKEDIHVYSIDEVFIDVTPYLTYYKTDGISIAKALQRQIYNRFGLCATVGIGTNLYLAKIALDIISKHNSSSIGILNKEIYLKTLGEHMPLSDFWQVGKQTQKRLEKYGIKTMNDISNAKPEILYKEFGINAKFLIDHSKGEEPCTIKQIKEYIPKQTSIANSQVLFKDYTFERAKLVLKEMIELGTLRLVDKMQLTNTVGIYVGYSKDLIKPYSKTKSVSYPTNSYKALLEIAFNLYDKMPYKDFPIRRIGFSFSNLVSSSYEQICLFEDYDKKQKEKKLFENINDIKQKYGRDKLIRAMDLEEGAMALQRNKYIGGHNASY